MEALDSSSEVDLEAYLLHSKLNLMGTAFTKTGFWVLTMVSVRPTSFHDGWLLPDCRSSA